MSACYYLEVRGLVLLAVACSAAPPARAPSAPPAPSITRCATRHVYGVLRDAKSQEPIGGVQVSLAGGDGQDDTVSDDDGRFDLRSTNPDRDHLVIFYIDDNITRALSSGRCDEEIRIRLGLGSSSRGIM